MPAKINEFVRPSQRPMGALPDVGEKAAFVILLWAGQAGLWLNSCGVLYDLVCPGGRGVSKALGRVLLEQRAERQKCQRGAVNALFQVDNPYSK